MAWGLHGGGVGRLEGGAEEVLLGHPVEWVGPFGGGVQGRGGYGDLRGDYVRAVWRGVVAAALLRVWGLRGLRRGGCVGVAWARRGGCMGAAWGWRGGGFWEQLGGCVLVVWGRYAAACVAWQLRGSGVAAVRGQCGGHLWAV